MLEKAGPPLRWLAVTAGVILIALVGWLALDVRVATPACHGPPNVCGEPPPPPTTPPPTATPTPEPTVTPTATPTATPSPAPTPIALTQGNVDCDTDVDSVDGLKVQRHVAGLPVSQQPGCPAIGSEVASFFGDVDCDNDIDAVDALGILRFVVVLPVNQLEPCPGIGEAM